MQFTVYACTLSSHDKRHCLHVALSVRLQGPATSRERHERKGLFVDLLNFLVVHLAACAPAWRLPHVNEELVHA